MSYVGKVLLIVIIYCDIDVLFMERNRLNVTFARTRLRGKICWFHIEKYTPKLPLIKSPNVEPKNETKIQPSSEPKESQQPSNLKRRISHQDPVIPSKYPRQKNIIDPVDNERSLNDIEKQENHDHAFGEFSKRYGEPCMGR